MWDHKMETHPTDQSMDPVRDFNFTILERHRDPMTRQLEEVVRVTNALNRQRHTNNKSIEEKVDCLNRRDL